MEKVKKQFFFGGGGEWSNYQIIKESKIVKLKQNLRKPYLVWSKAQVSIIASELLFSFQREQDVYYKKLKNL